MIDFSFVRENYYYFVALIVSLTMVILISIFEMIFLVPAPPVLNTINYDGKFIYIDTQKNHILNSIQYI